MTIHEIVNKKTIDALDTKSYHKNIQNIMKAEQKQFQKSTTRENIKPVKTNLTRKNLIIIDP